MAPGFCRAALLPWVPCPPSFPSPSSCHQYTQYHPTQSSPSWCKPLPEWLLGAELRSLWGPVNRKRQRLNRTRSLPAKEPLVMGDRGAPKGQSMRAGGRTAQAPTCGLLLWGLGLTPQGRAESTGPGHAERGPPPPPAGPRVLHAQHGPTAFVPNLRRLPPQRRFHHHLRREQRVSGQHTGTCQLALPGWRILHHPDGVRTGVGGAAAASCPQTPVLCPRPSFLCSLGMEDSPGPLRGTPWWVGKNSTFWSW